MPSGREGIEMARELVDVKIGSYCRLNTTIKDEYRTSRISRRAGILPGMTASRQDKPSRRSAAAHADSRAVPVSAVLGRRIKECRHAADKSQETLAFEAQVDRTYISAIERGIANPSIETLADICHAIGISLAALFEPMTEVPRAPSGERRANAATPPEIKRSRLR